MQPSRFTNWPPFLSPFIRTPRGFDFTLYTKPKLKKKKKPILADFPTHPAFLGYYRQTRRTGGTLHFQKQRSGGDDTSLPTI
jgi:hypothetical protein